MTEYCILDTNVLLYDPQAMFHFKDKHAIIAIEVIEEVDNFKHDVSERGRNSRMVAKLLDGLRKEGSLAIGQKIKGGGVLQVVSAVGDITDRKFHKGNTSEALLHLAKRLANNKNTRSVAIITKNVHLRLKADALGITANDYTVGQLEAVELQKGWRKLEVNDELITRLNAGKAINVEKLHAAPNEYLHLYSHDNENRASLAKVDVDCQKAREIKGISRDIAGIRPLNIEQAFLMDALLDDKINLIMATGKAGTGKTLLAIAAGLYKLFAEKKFRKVLVFRPTMPVSRDIGFLPGDISEKMRPWMQPVYDALELLKDLDQHSSNRILPPDIMECEDISVEPLTYIRGRSIPKQFIIIDEAQNLTPLEVKTVITRVGANTKIILTGDPQQIDNPYVDAISSGLTYLVDKFRYNELSAHIALLQGERSALAEAAANLL